MQINNVHTLLGLPVDLDLNLGTISERGYYELCLRLGFEKVVVSNRLLAVPEQQTINVEEIPANAAQIFFEKFKGQVIVDLGPGNISAGYEFANEIGAAAYVGCELHFGAELHEVLSNTDLCKFAGQGIPWIVVNTEMRTLLTEIASSSVSVLASRIDDTILKCPTMISGIGDEIKRVLHPTGAYYSRLSVIAPSGIESLEFDINADFAHSPSGRTGIYWKAM